MRTRLLLLGGQAVCLGLACAFLVVPASSVFLTVYGAQRLPYTYLTVAVAGVVVSSLMARAQRRLSLAALATTVLAAFTLVVAAAWAALSLAGAEWVTFPLLVLFPLSIPVGFVLVGAQAGRLLDVRQIKAHFPRVVAGFSIGFAVGGVTAARLVAVLGGPADLLLVDVAAGLAFLGLAVATARRFPDQLAVRPVRSVAASGGLDDPPPPTLRSLLRNRLVVVVLGYQLLSAAVTQLLDFVVWERAAARYPDPSDLARFLGVFGAVINVVSVAFVFGLAGVLLSRYGVRLGLAANPVGVLVLLAVSTAVGLAGGPGTTAFFLLVCAQQVVDIALTDGTTRTSINATYQALPTAERLAAQTRVEGVGVPLALGLAGVLVLLWSATGLGIVALVGVVLVITVAWLVLAVRAYRLYGTNLRRTLTRRAWDPVALRVDDDASLGVVTRLLASPDLRDVAVGLDALADAGHPSLEGRVAWLLDDHDPGRRLAAVAAARRCGVAGVVPRLVAMARDTGEPAPLRAAAVRAAGVLGAPPEALRPLAADADPGLRASAAVAALGGPGDGDGERPASGAVLDRLRAELTGDDPVAATAALRVLADTPHAAAVPALVALAARRRPPEGLAEALAAHADALVPATADALGSLQPGARTAAPGSSVRCARRPRRRPTRCSSTMSPTPTETSARWSLPSSSPGRPAPVATSRSSGGPWTPRSSGWPGRSTRSTCCTARPARPTCAARCATRWARRRAAPRICSACSTARARCPARCACSPVSPGRWRWRRSR